MRYVVLQFEGNEEAEEYVRYLKAFQDNPPPYTKGTGGQVIGLFAGPTQFCTCTGGKGRIHAWTLGQKFGWWVCRSCKKPAKASHGPLQQMRSVVSQARNLLLAEEEDQAEESVFQEGWGALGR